MMAKQTKIFTLVFIWDETRMLLGLKKRGFGSGKWNGFGGKVENGETIEEAAHRELKEECNLVCDQLNKIAVLTFEFVGNPLLFVVHVFGGNQFSGELIESEEMKPQWFPIDKIPYQEMWADDHIWFPLMLNGSRFCGFFKFEQTMTTIVDYVLREVTNDCVLQPILSI